MSFPQESNKVLLAYLLIYWIIEVRGEIKWTFLKDAAVRIACCYEYLFAFLQYEHMTILLEYFKIIIHDAFYK